MNVTDPLQQLTVSFARLSMTASHSNNAVFEFIIRFFFFCGGCLEIGNYVVTFNMTTNSAKFLMAGLEAPQAAESVFHNIFMAVT